MPKARQSSVANPLTLKNQTPGYRAASFIQQHMNDRHFLIGGLAQDGWVMQWCMRLIDSDGGEHEPYPSLSASQFAFERPDSDSDYPNQEDI